MPEDGRDTILIVDDEEMVVRSLEGFLTLETSYRVLTFLSPIEALEAIDEEDTIRVVVADFMMPEMDGAERSALFDELSSRVSALEAAHGELAGFREKLVKAFL